MEKKIRFKYEYPEDYNPVYVNGACGGIMPTGEITANFFLERQPLPRSVTNSVNDNGAICGTEEVVPADLDESIVRYISCGVVMSEPGARAIYAWLGQQLKKIDEQREMMRQQQQAMQEVTATDLLS